jgi:hypothetical protein
METETFSGIPLGLACEGHTNSERNAGKPDQKNQDAGQDKALLRRLAAGKRLPRRAATLYLDQYYETAKRRWDVTSIAAFESAFLRVERDSDSSSLLARGIGVDRWVDNERDLLRLIEDVYRTFLYLEAEHDRLVKEGDAGRSGVPTGKAQDRATDKQGHHAP